MQDAMVTARMSQAKKEQGSRVLKSMGESASSAINDLFDYVIKNNALPTFAPSSEDTRAARLKEAVAWADSICLPNGNAFAGMTDDEIRAERLKSKGLM